MKVIQLEDEPFLPTPCRIKKVIELEEDIPTITTSITEERQGQDIKQKQPLKSYPLWRRTADTHANNYKQGILKNILVQIERSNHQQEHQYQNGKRKWRAIASHRNC